MPDRDELEIVIPDQEGWDNEKEEFVCVKGMTLRMKHSLLSISKWEMKWKKPFLKPGYEMTPEETVDYYKCMTINQNVNPDIYSFISEQDQKRIHEYIGTPMSAYQPPKKSKKSASRAAIVSERIYFWMASNNIPSSYEKWHLSRLLNLLEIAAEENTPKEKMSTEELFRRNHDLNMARRKALKSRG